MQKKRPGPSLDTLLGKISDSAIDLVRECDNIDVPSGIGGLTTRCMGLNKRCVETMVSMLKENIDLYCKCSGLEKASWTEQERKRSYLRSFSLWESDHSRKKLASSLTACIVALGNNGLKK